MKVLVIVDMQVDFINGFLSNSSVEELIEPMRNYIKEVAAEGYKIVFTQVSNTGELLDTRGRNLCIKGTLGWQVDERLYNELDAYSSNLWAKEKYVFVDVMLPTFIYNMLENIPSEEEGEEMKEPLEEIILAGVFTDTSVISNALILKSSFPKVPVQVVEGLTIATTEDNQNAALAVMEACGIELI